MLLVSAAAPEIAAAKACQQHRHRDSCCAGPQLSSLVARLLGLVDEVLQVALPPLCHGRAGFSGAWHWALCKP